MSNTSLTQYRTPFFARRGVQNGIRYAIAAVAIFFALFPVVWIVSAALNPTGSMATQKLIPDNATLRNFEELLNDPIHPYWIWLGNSIKVSGVTAILGVVVTTLSAFAFSRFRFRGRRSLLLTILLIQVFPNSLAIVAVFLLLQQIGNIGADIPFLASFGLDTHGGLILIYLGGQMGINVWLMKGFFDTIPREIDESAQVDGATTLQSFWYLILPLVRPVLAVVGILAFVGTFNEFIIARVVLRSTEAYTLMVGLYLFVGATFAQDWGKFAAGALIGAAPIVLLYLLLQDQIVGGLTQGAVKG
jgi:arabinogalactan oligomer/maltooligosaccharide transport system permease protein